MRYTHCVEITVQCCTKLRPNVNSSKNLMRRLAEYINSVNSYAQALSTLQIYGKNVY